MENGRREKVNGELSTDVLKGVANGFIFPIIQKAIEIFLLSELLREFFIKQLSLDITQQSIAQLKVCFIIYLVTRCSR